MNDSISSALLSILHTYISLLTTYQSLVEKNTSQILDEVVSLYKHNDINDNYILILQELFPLLEGESTVESTQEITTITTASPENTILQLFISVLLSNVPPVGYFYQYPIQSMDSVSIVNILESQITHYHLFELISTFMTSKSSPLLCTYICAVIKQFEAILSSSILLTDCLIVSSCEVWRKRLGSLVRWWYSLLLYLHLLHSYLDTLRRSPFSWQANSSCISSKRLLSSVDWVDQWYLPTTFSSLQQVVDVYPRSQARNLQEESLPVYPLYISYRVLCLQLPSIYWCKPLDPSSICLLALPSSTISTITPTWWLLSWISSIHSSTPRFMSIPWLNMYTVSFSFNW